MNLFVDGKVNPLVFETDLRRGTRDLADVLAAAVTTHSPSVESTHLLMALAGVAGGVTQNGLSRLGITREQWESGLSQCAMESRDDLPPAHLTRDALHDSALATLDAARDLCREAGLPRITEAVLLLCAIRHATVAVRRLCDAASLDLDGWAEGIETSLKPVRPVVVFNEDEGRSLRPEAFSPGALKALNLMKTETESLGYPASDPRHLVLALISKEGGVAEYALFRQGLLPRKIQEALMLSLKGKAKGRRSEVPLAGASFQPVLKRILNQAGEMAGRDHAGKVFECHILRAFLSVESMARNLLEDEKVRLDDMLATAEKHDFGDEEEEDEATLADLDAVRTRLRNRLVGQDEAIERILPFIQRMRFGFTVPERPVGVFLFCGQSGSGKTEMAKELARAVYGSEENLIFLEMGQFNSPESMNIFVGAPPGYVGYGEGKLTNGLRDKPRSVVLFDEVEKAHPRVLDALLRFLDEGRIDDPAGPVRDGSRCIVILTSNVGANELSRLARELENKPESSAVIRRKLREEFERHEFRVEFLNRVDELILFRTLDKGDYACIARRLLERNLERLEKERSIRVTVEPDLARLIGDYCAEIGEGARAAARLVQSVVVTPVIDFVMGNGAAPPLDLKVRGILKEGADGAEPAGLVERNG